MQALGDESAWPDPFPDGAVRSFRARSERGRSVGELWRSSEGVSNDGLFLVRSGTAFAFQNCRLFGATLRLRAQD